MLTTSGGYKCCGCVCPLCIYSTILALYSISIAFAMNNNTSIFTFINIERDNYIILVETIAIVCSIYSLMVCLCICFSRDPEERNERGNYY